ncbi:MAG: hypothetical protein MZW92_30830 [Comamonadaceae bacterium]|nr:hypothetical protein [Comamonadaceae bacterium]
MNSWASTTATAPRRAAWSAASTATACRCAPWSACAPTRSCEGLHDLSVLVATLDDAEHGRAGPFRRLRLLVRQRAEARRVTTSRGFRAPARAALRRPAAGRGEPGDAGRDDRSRRACSAGAARAARA